MLRETGSRLSTNIGTGFRAPSLFQLYSSYGDENLQPEKSLGLDAGIEQRFMSGRLVLGETYFHNRFRDLITFDPGSFLYANTSRAVTQGLETTASFELSADLKLEGNYTWLDAENSETHEELLRRARHRAALWLDWSATEDISLSAGLKFAGLRYDTDYSSYPAARVNLASYATLNLGASYRLSPACSLFVRGENLLDREYEEVSGFGVAGAAVYAGVKFTGGI